MKSIRDIYKSGRGPSSSHTMGPERASMIFRSEHPEAASFRAVLYGSLAKTGAGHGTDRIIRKGWLMNWRTRVTIKVLPPVSAEEVQERSIKEVMNEVHDKMVETLAEIRSEKGITKKE